MPIATIAILALGLLAASEPAPAAQLLQLESVWNKAHLAGDAEALDRLWADDIVIVVPRMQPMSKQGALAFFRTGRFKFDRYATSEISVRPYGDAAVVTGRLERSRLVNGEAVRDDWRFTKVYVRHDRTWRVVSFHASEAGP